MWKNDTPKHLLYSEKHLLHTDTPTDASELERLKKDFLTISDERCKIRIYSIIKAMEE